jgi:hypothetical protein
LEAMLYSGASSGMGDGMPIAMFLA